MCVALGQLFLTGGGDQDVAIGLQDASFVWRGVGEAHDGPVGLETKNKHKCERSIHPKVKQVR